MCCAFVAPSSAHLVGGGGLPRDSLGNHRTGLLPPGCILYPLLELSFDRLALEKRGRVVPSADPARLYKCMRTGRGVVRSPRHSTGTYGAPTIEPPVRSHHASTPHEYY